MASIHRHALMPFSALQMYQIVNDVRAYPDFLPWCAGGQVLRQDETSMEARIRMQKGKLNHSFTTRNDMVPGRSIHIELVEGPFKKLNGDWSFSELSETSCKIELKLDFDFSNRIVAVLIGPVFTQIANSLVDAFCRRAHQIYGQTGQS